MTCVHGLGLGHMILDLFMLVPVIGVFIFGIRMKFKKDKKK